VRKFFLDNLGLKITAVLLSILLWLFATARGQSEISLDVPLELKNIPSGLEVLSQSVKSVSLNVRGQERLIRSIRPSDIRVSINLSKAKKGEGIYTISKNNIKLHHTITVTNITPTHVKVLLEETATRTVEIKPVVVGTPEKGFYVKSIEVVPRTVVIEGKRAEVYRLDTIKTEPMDITGLKETFTMDSRLNLTGTNIRTKTDDVEIRVVIAGRKK
jgi:YbbR domain-containing protein